MNASPQNSKLDQAYEAFGEQCAEYTRGSVEVFQEKGLLQSPIEHAMAEALLIMDAGFGWELDGCQGLVKEFGQNPRLIVEIKPQHAVGSYRLDFAVKFRDAEEIEHFIAVECDGHDFHEKTKKQAAHDKKRDRYLQREGYKVLRFTGSEIYADPVACAKEVGECICQTIYPRRRVA